jgi:hypothetical protein
MTLSSGAVICRLQVSPSLRTTTAQLACRANANHGWSAYGGGKSDAFGRRCPGIEALKLHRSDYDHRLQVLRPRPVHD